MKLDKRQLDIIERDIRPPLRSAITIPVLTADGTDSGVVIYVGVSSFGDAPALSITEVAKALGVSNVG